MDELDLHWTSEDPDLGIASDGVLCKDMDDIVARITQVKDTVKTINLDSQPALKEIPAVIGECKLIEELNVSHTEVKELPDFIFALPNLKFLSCRCTEFKAFPKSLANAANLDKLHFRVNKGCSFPEDICALKKLRHISFDLYINTALPSALGAVKTLEVFNMFIKYEDGDVPSLPDSFASHPALKRIWINYPFNKNIKSFDLAGAAKTLSTCKTFESLKLSGIKVGKDHQSLSLLPTLKELELRHLTVEGNVFVSITALHNLESLAILGSKFRITELPDIFANMKELKNFSFAGNMVLDLPPSIYSLEKLTTLEIGSTGISVLDNKIENLKNLESLQVYDNILEKLPASVFTLPNLKVLNIEENNFSQTEIDAMDGKVNDLAQKGQKIEFIHEGQGHRQMVKKLRSIKDVAAMDKAAYIKTCLSAVKENPYAVKYIDPKKMKGTKYYAELCLLAVRKSCFAIENIDAKALGKFAYFYICNEAARSPNIGSAFKFIRSDLLNNDEYIQISIEAALHNKEPDFLNHFNNEAFDKRFSRQIYERICWVAVLHNPSVFSKMKNPTKELETIVPMLTVSKKQETENTAAK